MDQHNEKYLTMLRRVTPERIFRFLLWHLRAEQYNESDISRSKYIHRSWLHTGIRMSDHFLPDASGYSGADVVVRPDGVYLDGELLPPPARLTSHISILHAIKSALKTKYAHVLHEDHKYKRKKPAKPAKPVPTAPQPALVTQKPKYTLRKRK